MDIFTFAHFPKFDENLRFLADNLARKEIWHYSQPEKEFDEGNVSAKFKYPILRNYLEHTFRKITAEGKVAYSVNNQYACFNTGLVTPNLEEIYAFFEENKAHNKLSPFYFRAFIKKSDREFLNIFSDRPPLRADYFSSPHLLIFNPTYELIPDIDHIIEDSIHRFPKSLQSAKPKVLRTLLGGAIEEVKKLAKTNYRLAIPQYRENKIHLLLPLHLEDETNPDLALSVEQINNNTYSCYMCLTMGMAYNNARLIVCPLEAEWLKP